MKNMYEIITIDENGCVWNWEDEENNVIIEAARAEEAEQKFIDNIDYEYEEEASKYFAREIEDIEGYKEVNHYIEW